METVRKKVHLKVKIDPGARQMMERLIRKHSKKVEEAIQHIMEDAGMRELILRDRRTETPLETWAREAYAAMKRAMEPHDSPHIEESCAACILGKCRARFPG